MSGNKNSGRKRKSLSRENAMRRMTALLPGAIDTIEETILGKNKDRLRYESAIEIKDTVMGKPKQTTELTGGAEVGSMFFVELFKAYAETRRLETRLQIGEGKEEV